VRCVHSAKPKVHPAEVRSTAQIISIKHLNTSDEQQHLSQLMGAEYRESQSCFEVIKNEGARRGHRK